jgi:hypothetical protein
MPEFSRAIRSIFSFGISKFAGALDFPDTNKTDGWG